MNYLQNFLWLSSFVVYPGISRCLSFVTESYRCSAECSVLFTKQLIFTTQSQNGCIMVTSYQSFQFNTLALCQMVQQNKQISYQIYGLPTLYIINCQNIFARNKRQVALAQDFTCDNLIHTVLCMGLGIFLVFRVPEELLLF